MAETSATNAGGKAPSKLQAALDAPLVATGGDVPDGSYGATLYGFSEPFEIKSQFAKTADGMRTVFEANFGIFDKNGTPTSIAYLLPFNDGGAANKRSNLYKMLKALAAGTKLMTEDGNFADGVTLKSFYGTNGVLSVKKNAKGWPNVEAVGAKMDGAKYPTLEQCNAIPEAGSSEELPF